MDLKTSRVKLLTEFSEEMDGFQPSNNVIRSIDTFADVMQQRSLKKLFIIR
jgi:hypothetical protein